MLDPDNPAWVWIGMGIFADTEYILARKIDPQRRQGMFGIIYKKCLRTYAGNRLGWKELQRFFEKESGLNLSWFFEHRVRSNKYLCYQIESQESKEDTAGFYEDACSG